MTITGDTPISLDEPMFTHGEVVRITGINSKSLSQWSQRIDAISAIGQMHRTGRKLYSVYDLIELKVIGDVVSMAGVQPSLAASASKYVRERAIEMSERDSQGQLLYRGQKDEDRRLVIFWFEGASHRIKVIPYSQRIKELSSHSIPYPQIVIPLDDIILSVQNKIGDVLEEEGEEGTFMPHSTKQYSSPWPRTPEQDFSLRCAKDEQGRDIYIGLSHEETHEMLRFEEDRLNNRDTPESGDRYLELYDKHEAARLKRIMERHGK